MSLTRTTRSEYEGEFYNVDQFDRSSFTDYSWCCDQEIVASCTGCTFEDDDPLNKVFFLPSEVAIHNKWYDCWLSYNGMVYDLTELCENWEGTDEIKPILINAGKDISHWFDHDTNDIRHYIHPETGTRLPYCPHGPIPDLPSSLDCRTPRQPLDKCPWWLDKKYKKGRLTRNPRPCRILNVLAGTETKMMVCEEDNIRRIRERFLMFNSNAMRYVWTFEGKCLNLDATLTENGIPDERDRFTACGIPEDYYIPSLMCYFNDKEE